MSRQKEIYQELQSLSDPKYKEFHGGLVPGEENLLGVRIPALRRYARELFTKSGGRADILLQEIGDSCYEEITLQGMIIGHAKECAQRNAFCTDQRIRSQNQKLASLRYVLRQSEGNTEIQGRYLGIFTAVSAKRSGV